MSRWHVLAEDRPNRTVTIAHACPGSHTPWTELMTYDRFEQLTPHTNLGEKITYVCKLCDFVHRPAPHMPGPADIDRDLQPGAGERWLELIHRNWLEGRSTA